ncbi:MAG: hypothetical protein H7239_12355 [Flavobacterium sp.]|nr:hypothetical protein [Flavobacterium sp.]
MKLNYNPNLNSYSISNPKTFSKNKVQTELLEKVFDFTHEMVFGTGFHRKNRSGGQIVRKNGALFCNTFQGKLSEVVLNTVFEDFGIETSKPDFSIHGEGIWDDFDLIVNKAKISVKSCAHFSNLLLLESKDWDKNGVYIPDQKPNTQLIDYFVLVRIFPDIKAIFNKQKWLYLDNINKETLKNFVLSTDWFYDIPGCCTLKTLKYCIENNYLLPQNSWLNTKTKIDANNYYIQTGNLKPIEVLLEILR